MCELRAASDASGPLGDDWGCGDAKEEAQKMYDALRAAGGNFADTAKIYTNGTSESFLGDFMMFIGRP